jgi:hypothetical protein
MITGHRQISPGREDAVVGELRRVFTRLRDEHEMGGLLTGMAIGADQMAVRALEIYSDGKASGPEAEGFVQSTLMPFDAYVPFPGQPSLWPTSAQTFWWCTLGRARKVFVQMAWIDPNCPWFARMTETVKSSRTDTANPRIQMPELIRPGSPTRNDVLAALHGRNDAMIRRASGAVAVWDGRTSGGTYSAVQKIQKAGMPLVVIDPSGSNRTRMIRPTV